MLSLYHKHVSNGTISKIGLFVGCVIDIYDINSHILPHYSHKKKQKVPAMAIGSTRPPLSYHNMIYKWCIYIYI